MPGTVRSTGCVYTAQRPAVAKVAPMIYKFEGTPIIKEIIKREVNIY